MGNNNNEERSGIQSLCRYIIYDDPCWTGEFADRALLCQMKSVHDLSDAWLCLKHLWATEELIRKGTHVGVVGVSMNEEKTFVIDKKNGYLVVEPDSLVSITSVVSTYFCDRKTVFNERIRLPLNNRYMLEGIIGHEMIGRAMLLQPERRTRSQIQSIAWNVVHSSGVMLKAYGLGMTSHDLTLTANSLINYVLTFLNDHYDASPGRNQSLKIHSVLDIEDNIWSPAFGLKGKFDATVMTEAANGQTYVSPLEFKAGHMDPTNRTGKADHVGQVQLYSLLMRERYENVTTGLLYYLRPNTWIESKMERSFLQPLIIARNLIVISKELRNGTFVNLPKASVNPNMCLSCEHRMTCSLLTRTTLVESLDDFKNVTEEALIRSTHHLSKEEIEFFKAWFTVITAETEAAEKRSKTKRLWTVPATERESMGRCITNMIFISAMDVKPYGYDGIFAKFSQSIENRTIFEKLEFQPQDLVIVSTAKSLCLTYGIIESINFPDIILRLERVSSQFMGTPESRSFLIIDSVESSSAMAIQYGYLQALMADNAVATRLRRYIIKKEKTLFPSITPAEILKHGKLRWYNRMQKEVIVNAIRTDSFLFVKGMPGSGKTNIIVRLLHFLTRMGKSVLLTAYTGTAVDNILIRCYGERLDFIRIGEPKVRHFAIVQRMDKTIIQNSENLDQMRSTFTTVPIVATTLLNLKHEIFQVRKFDYVIVDEASQALPSAVFGALLLAEKYILVGDPAQLSSILLTKATIELGLEDNFFTMMATAENTKVLNEQYRMNEVVMHVSNQLMYSGGMACHPNVAKRCLHIQPERISGYLESVRIRCEEEARLMEYIFDCQLERSVVVIDLSDHNSVEQKVESSISNEYEADVVAKIARGLLRVGIEQGQIGIIAPYRGQVNLISRLLRDVHESKEVEVNTVDQYQGREKEIIICSFTKTRPALLDGVGEAGTSDRKNILEDIRRLNVAVTRAMVKLIIIGHVKSLITYEPMAKLFETTRADQVFR